MDLSNQIIAKLRLTSERKAVSLCLEEFTASFFAPNAHTNTKALFATLPNGIGQVLEQAFLKSPITPQNERSIKTQIEKLQEKLAACKTLQMTLAFEPDEAAINSFSAWIKHNATPDTLIDLQFDRSIIGGALLVSNGIYKDYSLKRTLSDKFQLQKSEIMEMLN